MTHICDLCRSSALEPVYWPERSGHDTVVHLCGHCGLVQSLPRGGDTAALHEVLGEAQRAKRNRAAACLKLLRAHADLNAALSVLDIDSDAGAFSRALAGAAPRAIIANDDADAPAGIFDIVRCSRIERRASPALFLERLWHALKPGGLLIVDAPNLIAISGDEVIDEWFGDDRRYHYSPVTLGRALDAAGFAIIDGPDPIDRDNLTFAAIKRTVAHRPLPRDFGEAERARALIGSYSAARTRNLVALAGVAAELKRLVPRRVALWGAGRLFDSLVTHGGFDPKSLDVVIDSVLTTRATEKHGIKLAAPDALTAAPPGVVVVMSRTFAREIARLARRYAPKAEIVLYGDLLARARVALAA
jgi:hypothetical protein